MYKLRIYDVALAMVRDVALLARRVARFDSDLARQMRRCSTAVPLNIGEGMYARGRNRQARYHTAMAEAAETTTTIDTATASGYIDSVSPQLLDRLDHIRAVMWKLTR